MGSESNRRDLAIIRAIIGIPMVIFIVYGFYLLSQPQLFIIVDQIFTVVFGIILAAIVLILTSQAQVPWTNLENKHTQYFIEELEEQEKVYVIPTTCSHCKTRIELDKVRWENEYTLHCQECQAEIKLRIIENE